MEDPRTSQLCQWGEDPCKSHRQYVDMRGTLEYMRIKETLVMPMEWTLENCSYDDVEESGVYENPCYGDQMECL